MEEHRDASSEGQVDTCDKPLTEGQRIMAEQFAELVAANQGAAAEDAQRWNEEAYPGRSRFVGPHHILLLQYAYALEYGIEFKPDGGVEVHDYDGPRKGTPFAGNSLKAAQEWLSQKGLERAQFCRSRADEFGKQAHTLESMFGGAS